jgi:hypothetical protein
MYRRSLQKSLAEKLIGMIDNSQSGAIVFSFGGGGASFHKASADQ